MISFKILKQSKKSWARIGILKTPHGEIETPAFVPVATQGVIKSLTSEAVEQTKSQILIANAFHLHTKPGEHIVKSAGGLHKFMHWKKPLMTDSGGFQVFSLGFGKDFGVGKVMKHFPEKNKTVIDRDAQAKHLKITPDGVYFKSFHDGSELFLGPKESIKIQESLGADIIFAFDECTAPLATKSYVETALKRTHVWAKKCLAVKKSRQALFGITQGSHFKALREESAQFINALDFDGFGIGGDLGKSTNDTKKILEWTIPHLAPEKPRHLLGIGYLENIPTIIKYGIDLFDCTVPTHYARRGIAFTSHGKLQMNKISFLKDERPLDRACSCFVCVNYRKNYICHLLRAHELTAFSLLTFHNLYFFNTFVENIRRQIKRGIL